MLGRFASGVTVVTAISDGEPVGMTCQSFSSVSLDPPLVLFVPAKTSRAWPLIQRAGRFCVNFLADDQAELSNTMASRGRRQVRRRRAGTPSEATGSPLLDGTLGYVDCTIHAVHEAGDHYVVIGRVLDLGTADADGGAAAVLPGRVPHDRLADVSPDRIRTACRTTAIRSAPNVRPSGQPDSVPRASVAPRR